MPSTNRVESLRIAFVSTADAGLVWFSTGSTALHASHAALNASAAATGTYRESIFLTNPSRSRTLWHSCPSKESPQYGAASQPTPYRSDRAKFLEKSFANGRPQ